jgi:hypothetical protein
MYGRIVSRYRIQYIRKGSERILHGMTINYCLRIYKGGARDRHRYSVDGVVTKFRKAKAYFGSVDRHGFHT